MNSVQKDSANGLGLSPSPNAPQLTPEQKKAQDVFKKAYEEFTAELSTLQKLASDKEDTNSSRFKETLDKANEKISEVISIIKKTPQFDKNDDTAKALHFFEFMKLYMKSFEPRIMLQAINNLKSSDEKEGKK